MTRGIRYQSERNPRLKPERPLQPYEKFYYEPEPLLKGDSCHVCINSMPTKLKKVRFELR